MHSNCQLSGQDLQKIITLVRAFSSRISFSSLSMHVHKNSQESERADEPMTFSGENNIYCYPYCDSILKYHRARNVGIQSCVLRIWDSCTVKSIIFTEFLKK